MKTLTLPLTCLQNNSITIALFKQFKIYRTLFLVTFIIITQLAEIAYGQTTDTVHVTPLTSTGVCLENRFSAKFTTSGLHHITIQASINLNGSPILNGSCNDSVNKPFIFIAFDSATVVPNSQASDTLNGSWSCEISDSATIWYRVFIDCSVIPPNNTGSQNLNLVQEFTDPTNYFVYLIGGSNTFEVSNINTPRIVEPPVINVPSSYMNYSQVDFLYINTGSAPIEIEFTFSPDSTNYCGQLFYDSLRFKIGINGNYQALNPDSMTQVSIPAYDTLIINQVALVNSCLQTCNSANVTFRWQCNQPPSQAGIFCSDCLDENVTIIQFIDSNATSLKVERISPVQQLAQYDPSCFNDTTNKPQWFFQITNDGMGAVDSVWIDLLGGGDVNGELSLIPASSFSIQSNCGGCVDSIFTALRVNALCQDKISDPLKEARIFLKNFRGADTLYVQFETFRCASDSLVLLNNAKSLNSWDLSVWGKGVCNNVASLNSPGPAYFPPNSYNISSHSQNTDNDLGQNLVFTPVVTDLSVPPQAVFGDQLTQDIELNGGFDGIDRQAAGCTATPCLIINGYLKAVITCEKGLRIADPANDVQLKRFDPTTSNLIYRQPVYHHTGVLPDTCMEGVYSYYFDLNDTLITSMLDSGFFEFTLQACCVAEDVSDYSVKFYMKPDPNSCDSLYFPPGDSLPPVCSGTGCIWIPLSSIESDINVHCPGCKSPGLIVSAYNIRRTTFGLEDSNNDGLADTTLNPIIPGSPWYNAHELFLKPHHSSYGDHLEDFLTAHFQDGDNSIFQINDSTTDQGYTYQEMVGLGVTLPFLQLLRTIPYGLDTMNVVPEEFTFYIDTPDTLNPNCIDCGEYSINPAKYRTILQLTVSATGISQYLQLFPGSSHYFFTFDTHYDSLLNQYSGNLHDTLFATFDTLTPFTGFQVFQKYRLHVKYSQCNKFITHLTDVQALDLVSRKADIQNHMWLSGISQSHSAPGNIPQQPNTAGELDSLGWTLNPLDTVLIDSSFASSYIFYCETFGKFHYFFSQNVRNASRTDSGPGCDEYLNIITEVRTAGGYLKVYPYEYRPVSLYPDSFHVTVPPGYTITQATATNAYIINGTFQNTPTQNFPVPSVISSFTFNDSIIGPLACMTKDPSMISPSDSNQYLMSEYMRQQIRFTLQPDSCFTIPFIPEDSLVMTEFGLNSMPCLVLDSLLCPPDSVIILASSITNNAMYTNPHFQVSMDSLVIGQTHEVCWSIQINNNLTQMTGYPGLFTTDAQYPFIALPDSAYFPALTNWVFYGSGDTILSNGGIIALDSLLPAGNSISGQVCALYSSCDSSTVFDFLIGWDCDSFPSYPVDPDSVCFVTNISVELKDAPVAFGSPVKAHDTTYTLCQPFEILAEFNAQNNGSFYPHSVVLDSLPDGLQVLYAYISICDSALIDTLSAIDSVSWTISADNMLTVGFSDSSISSLTGKCLEVTVGFLPECEFAHQETLPDVILQGVTFCGDTLDPTLVAGFTGTFQQDSSLCTDCFSIEKMALDSIVFAGDTTGFQIIICANNAQPQTLNFSEYLPAGFTPLITLPDSVSLPAMGCDTLIITGTYNNSGNCGDPTMTNTATIYFGTDSISDSDCIHVYAGCAAQADTIIPDSAFASSYGSGFYNQTVYLDGVFFIDTAFIFFNCTILVNTGGQIIVLPGDTLTTDSTIVEGCDFMWQGIYLEQTGVAEILEYSVIRDAEMAIYANHKSRHDIIRSGIEDCVKGVYVPPLSSGNSVTSNIWGSRFGMFSASLKPGYPGQPTFGYLPYSGVELNDVVLQVGDAGRDSNYFYNMNSGIIGFRSQLVVENNHFVHIQKDTTILIKGGWNGASIASVGKLNTTAGSLTVNPFNSGAWTIEDTKTGIFTDYSDLLARGIDMTRMETGVYTQYCKDLLQSEVSYCTIEANRYGLFWINNIGSSQMIAQGNEIHMDGSNSSGIFLKEVSNVATSNYVVLENFINVNGGSTAVTGTTIYGSLINNNIIHLTGTPTLEMKGIVLEDGDSTFINCNTITGDNESDTLKTGISVSISSRTQVGCNSTDSTGYGFFFGGVNSETEFKGNSMNDHYTGLYLNKAAVIDQQPVGGSAPYHGNTWLDTLRYTSGYGAVNMNDSSQTNLQFSLFTTNQSNSDNNPKTPQDTTLGPFYVDDQGWFDPQNSGSTFECLTSEFCGSSTLTSGGENLRMMIAQESDLTSEFIEESKFVAGQQFYSVLHQDSLLRIQNTTYSNFYSTKSITSTGKLNSVKESYGQILEVSATVRTNLLICDSLITLFTDSILWLDSLNAASQVFNFDSQRESLILGLNQQQQLKSITLSTETTSDSLLRLSTYFLNGSISEEEIPDNNEKTVNEILLITHNNPDSLIAYLNPLLYIAYQCPYLGGPAVYRARTLLSMLADTISYYDGEICAQSGIFRSSQLAEENKSGFIQLIPNPANKNIEIRLRGYFTGICDAKLIDATGRLAKQHIYNCQNKTEIINISSLLPGVYQVLVQVNETNIFNTKLVISR